MKLYYIYHYWKKLKKNKWSYKWHRWLLSRRFFKECIENFFIIKKALIEKVNENGWIGFEYKNYVYVFMFEKKILKIILIVKMKY